MDKEVTLDINIATQGDLIPFADELPTKQAFKACHWGQCLELLSQLIEYSNKILLVTGVEGVGKSFLKQAFIEKLNKNVKVCDLTASNSWSVNVLMRRIAQGFGLEWSEATGSDAWVTPSGEEKNKIKAKSLVLSIDNADELSNNALASLLNLVSNEFEDKIHVVLFGGSNLEAKLSSSFFSESAFEKFHIIDIEPFTLDETRQYILHRCKLTGREYPNLYKEKLILKIHQLSDGVPKLINDLVRKFLSGKGLHNSIFQTTKSKMPVIMMLSCLIIGVLLTPVIAIKLLQPKNLTVAKVEEVEKAIKKFKNVSEKYEKKEIKVESKISKVENETLKIEDSSSKTEDKNLALAAKSIKDVNIKKLKEDIDKKNNEKPKIVVVSRADVKKSEENAQKAKDETPKTKIQAKKVTKALTGKVDIEYIRNLPSENYTLQLMAGSDENGIKKFLLNHKDLKNTFYYQTTRGNKNWFVLLHGNFSSKTEAIKADTALKNKVKITPWMRSYSGIKKNIGN